MTQKEQFKEAFLEIKVNVTAEDRDKCAKALNKSRRPINEYVNGNVYDNSTAFKIITFLRGEIDKRDQVLFIKQKNYYPYSLTLTFFAYDWKNANNALIIKQMG